MLGRKPCGYAAIDLPAPISSNAIWRNVVIGGKPRTLKSKAYLQWISDAGAMLNAQRPGMIEGPYCMTLTVTTKSRIDLDNTVKAVNDLLQSQGVVANDRLCEEITVRRGNVPGMSVLVCSTKSREASNV